jgi:hypothetical protein
MLTSCGLGDHLVQTPRRELFEAFVRSGAMTAQVQDAFQQHRWSDRPHVSVRMNRGDARTVSYTVIELGPAAARVWYHDLSPAELTAA